MNTDTKFIVGIVIASLVIILGGAWLLTSSGEKEQTRLSQPPLGEKIADMGQVHVERGAPHEAYNSNPPTSGPHYGDGVAGPGIKSEPVADELVLHSMEHGAAVLWYRPDMAADEIDRLKAIFSEASGKKIMIPRSGMDTPIALTSWNYLLKLDSIDEVKIKQFIATNNDRAPEKARI